MKAKTDPWNDAPDVAYESDGWGFIILYEQAGHQLDYERIARKLESEDGTPLELARNKFIADRFIRRIKGKPGRRPIAAERKLRLERDRDIAFYDEVTAELRKVDDDWNLLPKHLFTGTVKSAKQRYSRCKKVKADVDRELEGYIRTAARFSGVPLKQYKADLMELFSNRA